MNRFFRCTAASSVLLALSACATPGGDVAQLSPMCAQQYQQASEQVRGGDHAQEQRNAAYTHFVSPDCKREQEGLDRPQR